MFWQLIIKILSRKITNIFEFRNSNSDLKTKNGEI